VPLTAQSGQQRGASQVLLSQERPHGRNRSRTSQNESIGCLKVKGPPRGGDRATSRVFRNLAPGSGGVRICGRFKGRIRCDHLGPSDTGPQEGLVERTRELQNLREENCYRSGSEPGATEFREREPKVPEIETGPRVPSRIKVQNHCKRTAGEIGESSKLLSRKRGGDKILNKGGKIHLQGYLTFRKTHELGSKSLIE